MLKKDPEVTKSCGWRDAIAFSKPQTYNFSAHEKTQFSGKANSVVVTFQVGLIDMSFRDKARVQLIVGVGLGKKLCQDQGAFIPIIRLSQDTQAPRECHIGVIPALRPDNKDCLKKKFSIKVKKKSKKKGRWPGRYGHFNI